LLCSESYPNFAFYTFDNCAVVAHLSKTMATYLKKVLPPTYNIDYTSNATVLVSLFKKVTSPEVIYLFADYQITLSYHFF